ncbi:hypothetical protein OnM2_031055 [Erysiphe neolycopersici]|uniref:Uncharacterized protein n=1 Tax=Erysiphe neolycopersici TaxID=212602 RepID=A0A420HZ26_9PEZI|nr:hypothetical protein OnM2_031055 [Erysiphe neolycopersici]
MAISITSAFPIKILEFIVLSLKEKHVMSRLEFSVMSQVNINGLIYNEFGKESPRRSGRQSLDRSRSQSPNRLQHISFAELPNGPSEGSDRPPPVRSQDGSQDGSQNVSLLSVESSELFRERG